MSLQLPESIVDLLLDKLSSDDDFRAHFSRDARSAIAALGFAPAADLRINGGIWKCLGVKSLAKKEVIRQARATLRRQLTMSFLPQLPFAIEAAAEQHDQAA